jgi:hypothetical protein
VSSGGRFGCNHGDDSKDARVTTSKAMIAASHQAEEHPVLSDRCFSSLALVVLVKRLARSESLHS